MGGKTRQEVVAEPITEVDVPGFEDRWDDPAAYLNADPAGRRHYPGFGAEATRWLIEHRSIGALGIDTIGIDPDADTTFGNS